jgi:hypothetical protein
MAAMARAKMIGAIDFQRIPKAWTARLRRERGRFCYTSRAENHGGAFIMRAHGEVARTSRTRLLANGSGDSMAAWLQIPFAGRAREDA